MNGSKVQKIIANRPSISPVELAAELDCTINHARNLLRSLRGAKPRESPILARVTEILGLDGLTVILTVAGVSTITEAAQVLTHILGDRIITYQHVYHWVTLHPKHIDDPVFVRSLNRSLCSLQDHVVAAFADKYLAENEKKELAR